jgi:transcriptional regulator with XRE-family HTH domain
MGTSDLVVLGRALRLLRAGAGLTQSQLGGRVGIGKPYVSQIENGHLDIRWSTLAALLDAMGVSLVDLQAALTGASRRGE